MSYAPVDVPPVMVDTADVAAIPNTFPLWDGPITRSADGSLWLAGFRGTSSGGTTYTLYKSTDGGAHWSIATSRGSAYPVTQHSAIWDGADSWLVLEQSTPTTLYVTTYNFATGAWTDGTSFTPSAEAQWACLARTNAGNLIAVYVVVTTHRMFYRFWNVSSSSWGPETRIGTDIEQVVSGPVYQQVSIGPVIVDAADQAHVFLWCNREDDSISLLVDRLYYGQISSSGTLTVNPALASPVRSLDRGTLRDNFFHGPWPDGIYRSESNEIILAEEYYSGDDTTHRTGVIRGAAPGSGSAISFSAVTLSATTDGPGLDQNKRPAFARSLNHLYPTLVLIAANLNPGSGSLEIWTQDAGAPWVGPLIYWDATVLPPDVPAALGFHYVESGTGTISSDSRMDYAIGALITFPAYGDMCETLLAGHSGSVVVVPPGARNFAYIGEFARSNA